MVTLGALNAFRTATAWADNAKLNLDGQGGVSNAGNYGGILSARNREQIERDANNAVRTELLKALARTFDIATTERPANGTHFSQKFMQKLETLLGSAFRRDDFKVGEDGVVSSGRPLTARRIKAILQSAQNAANIERYNDTIMINLHYQGQDPGRRRSRVRQVRPGGRGGIRTIQDMQSRNPRL